MITITKPYKEDMIIPITVSMIGDELNITVYKEFLSVAQEFKERFDGRYFSPEALRFLADEIECEGYTRYDPYDEYYLVFSTNEKCNIINNKVVDIENAVFYEDATEFEADIIKAEGEPASLIIEKGSIAAIAAANYFIEEDEEEVELAVETLPEYRGRGYGSSVLCQMINKVLDMGKIPTYRASVFNKASIATAKKCGFAEIGKEFYFNCYKEE